MEKKPTNLEEQANALYQQYCADKGIVYHLPDAAIFSLGYAAAQGRTGVVWVKAIEPDIKAGEYVAKFKPHNKKRHSVGVAFVDDKYVRFLCPPYHDIIWCRGHEELQYLQLLDESGGDWISVEDQLPEIGEYVLIYNTERATLVGRLMSNGWVAMFADGENFMGELTAVYWRKLPAAPRVK